MAEKTFKCGFRHCRHESPDVSGDNAVKIKNRYFHEDCAKDYENIEKVKSLYYEKISNTVVVAQLVNTINNILFKKNVDSDFLVFAVKYAINTKMQIKSPYSLHYIIDNYKVKSAWDKVKCREISKVKFEAKSNNETTFKAVPAKEKGIGNLFD